MGYAVPIVSHGGGSMRVYSGMRRQRGAGFFQSIARFALPIIRRLFPYLKSVGKRLATSAANVGSSLATDVMSGNFKNIPKNFKKKSREEINSLSNEYIGRDVFPTGEQGGSGRRRRPLKRKAINKKKKKKSCKKRKTSILCDSDRI